MIIKNAVIDKEVYLSAKRELIEEQKDETFETLFAQEYRTAKELGRQEGEVVGYRRAEAELGTLLTLVQRLSQKLLEQKKRLFQQMKPEMDDLVLLIAEKIIREQLKEPNVLNKRIEGLLDLAIHAFGTEQLKVFVAPKDLNLIHVEGILFLADPTLCPGDCRIEARSGIINGEITRLLEDLSC